MAKFRKRYTKEEKLEIVNQTLDPHCNIEELASRYMLHPNSIYKWRKELSIYQDHSFPGNGNKLMTAQEKENYDLKKRVRELELEREILKKAVGIFSSPNKISLLS